jgi:hypothetical protein
MADETKVVEKVAEAVVGVDLPGLHALAVARKPIVVERVGGERPRVVLDLENDMNARVAMVAYAGACEEEDPELAKALIALCGCEAD